MSISLLLHNQERVEEAKELARKSKDLDEFLDKTRGKGLFESFEDVCAFWEGFRNHEAQEDDKAGGN